MWQLAIAQGGGRPFLDRDEKGRPLEGGKKEGGASSVGIRA
jgi:hypothetical protein